MYSIGLISFIVFFIFPVNSHKCHHDLEVAWAADIGSAPVVSAPLLADVNGDNIKDIISTSFDGNVAVVDGRNGAELSGWPVQFPDKTFHAGPVLYDVNNDGIPEIVVCSSDGDIFFISSAGTLMEDFTVKLPPLWVRKGWYEKSLAQIMHGNVEGYETQRKPEINTKLVQLETKEGIKQNEDKQVSGVTADGWGVYVDNHILSTPLLTDIDGDMFQDELVIPVNYYFDTKLYSSTKMLSNLGLSQKEMSQYVACGIIIYNLWSQRMMFNITLELTLSSPQHPGLWMSSPTLVYEHDKKQPLIRIAAGTSQGNLHLVNPLTSEAEQQHKIIFTSDAIHTQVVSGYVTDSGLVELISVDNSGNVVCLDTDGAMLWESEISGSSPGGVRLGDVDGDGQTDVVIASNDGYLWVINGQTGKVSEPWPLKLEGRIQAPVLLTKLSNDRTTMDIIVPSFSGKLFVVTGDGHCVDLLELEQSSLTPTSSLVPMLADDLLPWQPGIELLLATTEGSLLCFGRKNVSMMGENTNQRLISWSAESLPCGRFTSFSDQVGIQILDRASEEHQSGRWFTLRYQIINKNNVTNKPQIYQVMITVGQRLVVQHKTHKTAGIYELQVPIPSEPIKAKVSIKLTISHRMCFEDSMFISFNMNLKDDIKWILLVPFAVMATTLLFLHGFPSSDLLPQTSQMNPVDE